VSKRASQDAASVWTSPYEPIDLDVATLPDLVREAAASSPMRPALIDAASGRALSYRTLAARIERVAAGLAAGGFAPGDVLALRAPNMAPWAGVALGAMAAGGAVTGISPLASRREIAAQLTDSGASVMVTVPELVDEARAASAETGVGEVIAIGEASGATPIAKLLATDAAAPDVELDPERVALLPYSSGTTGLPKGVMLTHQNLAAAVRRLGRGLRPTGRDAFLALAPFAHVMGFVVSLATPLVAGASVVMLGRFELDTLLAAIARHRVTVLPVPPPVFRALAHHPAVADHDLSSLELMVAGGAPVSPELQEAIASRFPHAVVGQGYGLTETSALIPVPDRDRGTAPGSVGRLAPDTELRVVDPATGRDLGLGERGELWARGPQVMAGYLGRPEATAQMIDPDGWLRTGDLGYVDAAGNLHVVERLKELIKVSSYQVAPAELEALLATHPQVADAAVIPRPDERTGEIPVAVVVARGALDPDELIAWVAERVAPYKRIRAVRLVEELPRTPAGKVLRRIVIDADRRTATALTERSPARPRPRKETNRCRSPAP
jgi:acyl-CoA synthetase (AMP-forming)/AMP-acid ligase II